MTSAVWYSCICIIRLHTTFPGISYYCHAIKGTQKILKALLEVSSEQKHLDMQLNKVNTTPKQKLFNFLEKINC